jgi:hypothetical protein
MNLFPAGFDEDGLLYVNTTLGDYPISLPDGPRDHRKLEPAYMLLSKGCPVTVSSVETAMPEDPYYGNHLGDTQVPFTRYDHNPRFMTDEDIRTLWAADSRKAGQWAMLDLQRICTVKSIQLNIPTYNLTTADPAEKYHEFIIEASADGESWSLLYDNRGRKEFAPHGYYEVEATARFIKVTFFHVAGNGFAAISGLRVFGLAPEERPEAVANLTVVRGPGDLRNATLAWTRSDSAEGYIVRYGISPDKLYNQYQVYGESVEIRTLTIGIRYYFRVDSFNAGGITEGTVIVGSV